MMQESGLAEAISFICISAIWGQYSEYFTSLKRQHQNHRIDMCYEPSLKLSVIEFYFLILFQEK